MKALLDTNICIAVMRGNTRATARLNAMSPGDCGVSAVTVYELFTGVEKCQMPERERPKVLRLLSLLHILSFDDAAAQKSAQVRAELERLGKPSGPYDTLLAGHALSLGFVLATNNLSEFQHVSGLSVEDWLA